MVLDLLLVLDGKDIITIYANQVIAALKHGSPDLKVQKIRSTQSQASIKSNRIVFFFTGDIKELTRRVHKWNKNIEYQFVHTISYLIVNLATTQTDNTTSSSEGVAELSINDDTVSTTDLTDLQSWWPRVVRFLFAVENFSHPFDCYLENLSEGYVPAHQVQDTILALFAEFGFNRTAINNSSSAYGFVILRYTSRNEDDKIRNIKRLGRTIKHLYVIGTCLEKPQSHTSSIELFSRAEILKCSLEILECLKIINIGEIQKKDSAHTRHLGLYDFTFYEVYNKDFFV